MIIITVLVFLLILSVLVLIHEAGHFFVAKKLGIKVEEFGYGLPPRAWGKQIGETIYSINWLPFGGFVKLYGEDEAGSGSVKVSKNKLPTKDVDRAFFSRPVWQRAAVVVAGVVMNAVLAVILFYIFLALQNFKTVLPLIPQAGTPQFAFVNQTNRPEGVYIDKVVPGSPAQQAGIAAPSRVITLNGQKITSQTMFSEIITANKGKAVEISWEDTKTGEQRTARVTPRINPPQNEGAVGVVYNFMPISIAVLSYDTPVQKVFSGITHTGIMTVYSFQAMGGLINDSFKEKSVEPVSGAVGGPVAIGGLVNTILQIPNAYEVMLQLLSLAALLSVSLAVFNILPIPALDGGRLFFILIEGITRKKVSPQFEARAHTIGMVVLLSIIILVTIKDVLQLIK